MKIIDLFGRKTGINTEKEVSENVEHDVVMVNIDGAMVEVTEDDSEVRKEQ